MENVECLDPETLAAYVDGLLGPDAVGSADRHIDHCSACRGELSALAVTHSFAVGSRMFAIVDGMPLEGRLGRYEVLRELGRGNMGVVVRAYDPELERTVAVKILSVRGLAAADARARLRREAQAMARLSHPNVVTVYDVLAHGDAVCIAMELVDGQTLARFARAHAWRDSLAVCVRAGRGLAAAHAAGLVHRDYKPDNVLCATDGRVVVSDFGLARSAGDGPETLAGTPAYMAPELFRGQPASAASDQFSFCVATWEALYGERPFAGDTLEELRAQLAAGVQRAAPAGSQVPPWVRTVLLRGLASDPAQRYATLGELLDALGRDPARRRRRIARLAVAALAGAVAVAALAGVHSAANGASCVLDFERPAVPDRTAIRDHEKALAVIEAEYGKDSDQRRVMLYNLALAYQRLPDADKAIAVADELIEISLRPGREAWVMIALALDLEAGIAADRMQQARAVELRGRALTALWRDFADKLGLRPRHWLADRQ